MEHTIQVIINGDTLKTGSDRRILDTGRGQQQGLGKTAGPDQWAPGRGGTGSTAVLQLDRHRQLDMLIADQLF